jgi:heat shock protein HslJ
MMGSGRKTSIVLVGLLLSLGACTEPVVVIDEPAEVETCEWLIPIGIELVNDYFYTLQETDLGPSGGDQALVPIEVLALNARGADLDARAEELNCDLDQLNQAIVAATMGLESSDPVVSVFLETVRAGVVGAGDTPIGSWAFVGGAHGGVSIEPLDGWPITLTIDEESASGSAGCNGYSRPLALEGGEWVWAPGAVTITELMCLDDNGEALPDVADIERRYSDAFGQIAGYSLDGDALTLTGPEVELRYVRRDGEPDSAGS